MKKLILTIGVVLGIIVQGWGQDANQTITDITTTKSNLEDSENKTNQLNNLYDDLKRENEKLQKRNDSIIKAIDNSTLTAQQILYKNNYELLKNNIKEIENLEKQIEEYQNTSKIALSGTIIATLVSPTSNALGTSFTDVIISNSKSILTTDLRGNKKTQFLNIIDKVVNPLITSIFSSNPVGTIVNNVLQQAVTFDNGKIKQEKLDQFIKSLQPHIEFYEKFDKEVDSYETQLIIYTNEINKQHKRLKNYKSSLYKAFNIDSSDDLDKQIDELFNKQNEGNLKITDITTINNSAKVTEAKRLIAKMPDFDIDKNSFTDSFNNYISQIINVLTDSMPNHNLKFDVAKLKSVISKLEQTKIKYPASTIF